MRIWLFLGLVGRQAASFAVQKARWRTVPFRETGQMRVHGQPLRLSKNINVLSMFCTSCDVYAIWSDLGNSLPVTGSNQAYRAISTGQLNVSLRLHLRPIDVVVYHGPQGDLVLRGASRLDAFSGYPVRS